MSKTIIIGGVAGGATAAARLRRLDENMEIIIFERGEYISYANCGLPYYIGDVIKERDALMLQTPEAMIAKFNVDVRIRSEVVAIDKDKKQVKVLENGNEYNETYDNLVIATGSSPLKPSIPGIDGDGIYSLWTIPDTDKIREIVDQKMPKTAAVIGGGFIGLEMAENLHKRGIKITVIEAQDQIMTTLDSEMAQLLRENMEMNNVELYLGDGVKSFEANKESTTIKLASGKTLEVDLVILSIGIKPNSNLAKDCGIKINQRGGIIVDKNIRTTVQNIWAVGDVIEIENFITKTPGMIPLAGPANKQGRIVADNIVKVQQNNNSELEEYKGSMGTAVAQVFDLTAASVGTNEKTLISSGSIKNKNYYVALINQKSHAGYYPMATPITLKIIFAKNGKILGAQIVGQDGVDKRIDTIATTIRLGGDVRSLAELELSYAPPYSSAKDPVNMLGFVAQNILDGLVSFIEWNEINREMFVLDVTEDVERIVWSMEGSYHIPLGQLRKRLVEIPKDKLIVIYCAIGVRAYNAARILMQNGFANVKVLSGGSSFYKSMSYKLKETSASVQNDAGEEKVNNDYEVKILDCCGLQCPGPIMKVNSALSTMKVGEVLKVSATDMGFARDVESWCSRTGNTYLGQERINKENIVTLRKGTDSTDKNCCGSIGNLAELPQGKTIIVFDGDLDKVLASFIIANGAASMGRPVTMFFTFWGLNVLRRKNYVKVKKTFIEKMFGAMMPRGIDKLKLSNMNMMGMGTKMMKGVMKAKNVSSLEELMQMAMASGVKLIACTMSMDIMGIKPEELIDGVELAGVATYLGDAELANVNLFI